MAASLKTLVHATALLGLSPGAPSAEPATNPRDSQIEIAEETVTFDQFYRAHLSFVHRNARRLLGPRAGDADDLTQEVFVVAMRRLEDFEGRSTIRSWLFGILRRVVMDHQKTRKQALRGDPNEDIEELFNSQDRPDKMAEKTQASDLLADLLDKLDEQKREVFVMAELEQMSAPEIAEAVGAPVTTVYARLRDARKAFQQAVDRLQAKEAFSQGQRHG